MKASRGKEAPRPQAHPSSAPDADPEVPAWRADYVTCPACRRPVRQERLARHMELLHADYVPEPQPPEPAPEPHPAPQGRLWRLLGRIWGRRGG